MPVISGFRYFRTPNDLHYRHDPGRGQLRVSRDGLWVPADVTADELVGPVGAVAVPVEEVPCHLCMLVDGTVTRILVREWPDAIAITPRPAPVVAGHVVVVPKVHATGAITPSVAGLLAARAAELAAENGDRSWNYIQSNGRAASQTEPHFHAHLVPREDGDGLLLPWSPAPTHLEGDEG